MLKAKQITFPGQVGEFTLYLQKWTVAFQGQGIKAMQWLRWNLIQLTLPVI